MPSACKSVIGLLFLAAYLLNNAVAFFTASFVGLYF
jgi:hypothetical protein